MIIFINGRFYLIAMQNHLIGTLVIAVPIQDLEIQSLLQKLKAHVTHVEVLGYARPTH